MVIARSLIALEVIPHWYPILAPCALVQREAQDVSERWAERNSELNIRKNCPSRTRHDGLYSQFALLRARNTRSLSRSKTAELCAISWVTRCRCRCVQLLRADAGRPRVPPLAGRLPQGHQTREPARERLRCVASICPLQNCLYFSLYSARLDSHFHLDEGSPLFTLSCLCTWFRLGSALIVFSLAVIVTYLYPSPQPVELASLRKLCRVQCKTCARECTCPTTSLVQYIILNFSFKWCTPIPMLVYRILLYAGRIKITDFGVAEVC